MDLNAAAVFVKVIQFGSFSKAARAAEMPVSTVSAKVAALEKALGVSLIQRTTRKLHLTESGQIFFRHAVRALAELQQAKALTQEAQGGIRGRLKITAPVEIGMSTLADAISNFVVKHPETHVEMILTDRVVDLVGEGVDLALRMGELKDSTLISKRIGMSGNHAYASPAYLKKAAPLRKPQDLENHSCLVFTNIYDGFWTLEKSGAVQKVAVNGVFAANNLVAIHRVAADGRGVALLPPFLCQEDVEKKRLVQVLEGWATRKAAIQLVYPQQTFLPRSTRALVDHLAETLDNVF